MLVAEEAISKMEERLLQVICQGGLDRELREETLSRLRSYAFASVHHQVVFDCLAGLARREPETIRSLLPEWLVRAGFPDMDIATFFEPHELTATEARRILDQLAGAVLRRRTKSV